VSEIVDSNKLNSNKDFSCKNDWNSEDRIWTGFQFQRNDKNEPVYEFIKCGNVKLENDFNEFKKDSLISKACDCELVDSTNGTIECPNGKFINTYNPSTKKTLCCKLCTTDNSLMVTNEPSGCASSYNSKNETNLSCPKNQFLKGVAITPNTSKIECCQVKLEGDNLNKYKQLEEDCKKMGIDKCEIDKVNDMKKYCKMYGISDCSKTTLQNVENKCGLYGMRYYDTSDNKFKNTDSYIDCHTDNFNKMDALCKNSDVTTCSFYNLRQKHVNDINNLKKDIENIDKVEDFFEKTVNELKKATSNYKLPVVIFSIILFLLLIGLTVFYVISKNSVSK
jgi:hypothetical protein